MFSLGQGLFLSVIGSALLGWWLFVHGPAWVAGRAGKCSSCWQASEFCVCRPDLDQRVECDDGTEHFLGRAGPGGHEPVRDDGEWDVVFEPDGDWEFTAWEDLTDEEREEIG